ncbi:Crp/Fnr family transcriptional regulator [Streptomyces lavendulocolor]|uniref:Crp/Fnr family transcriptional regulator n=1 Tax=Streptomyces lavendulocolor TaxID=67316 RepID=UPI003C2CECC8
MLSVRVRLRGCVAERTLIGSSPTMRILGAGAVLGCMKVFDRRIPPPTATCLTDTWTISVPLERMRTLAESNASLMKAVGVSVADRLEATERIYNRHGLKPVQRLAGLLAHLVMHCAVPAEEADFRVEGPAQSDLAEALSLSIGSVEAALKTLREDNTVLPGYRTYEFPSLRRLLETSAIQFPPESLAGALAAF